MSVWDENAAERDKSADDEWVDEGGEDCVWSVRSNELANAGVDELVYEHDEKCSSCLV